MLKARKMQSDELPIVVAIEQSSNKFPWSLKNFEDCLQANNKAWIFSNDESEILAYAIVEKVVDEIHILNICVKPSVQGRGYGRELLSYIIDYANKNSSIFIVLEVRSSNKRAQDLYLQAGFNEMSVRKDYYPAKNGREDAILMGMDLSFL